MALVMDILELRSYERAKRAVDSAHTQQQGDRLPPAVVDRVFPVIKAIRERRNG